MAAVGGEHTHIKRTQAHTHTTPSQAHAREDHPGNQSILCANNKKSKGKHISAATTTTSAAVPSTKGTGAVAALGGDSHATTAPVSHKAGGASSPRASAGVLSQQQGTATNTDRAPLAQGHYQSSSAQSLAGEGNGNDGNNGGGHGGGNTSTTQRGQQRRANPIARLLRGGGSGARGHQSQDLHAQPPTPASLSGGDGGVSEGANGMCVSSEHATVTAITTTTEGKEERRQSVGVRRQGNLVNPGATETFARQSLEQRRFEHERRREEARGKEEGLAHGEGCSDAPPLDSSVCKAATTTITTAHLPRTVAACHMHPHTNTTLLGASASSSDMGRAGGEAIRPAGVTIFVTAPPPDSMPPPPVGVVVQGGVGSSLPVLPNNQHREPPAVSVGVVASPRRCSPRRHHANTSAAVGGVPSLPSNAADLFSTGTHQHHGEEGQELPTPPPVPLPSVPSTPASTDAHNTTVLLSMAQATQLRRSPVRSVRLLVHKNISNKLSNSCGSGQGQGGRFSRGPSPLALSQHQPPAPPPPPPPPAPAQPSSAVLQV